MRAGTGSSVRRGRAAAQGAARAALRRGAGSGTLGEAAALREARTGPASARRLPAWGSGDGPQEPGCDRWLAAMRGAWASYALGRGAGWGRPGLLEVAVDGTTGTVVKQGSPNKRWRTGSLRVVCVCSNKSATWIVCSPPKKAILIIACSQLGTCSTEGYTSWFSELYSVEQISSWPGFVRLSLPLTPPTPASRQEACRMPACSPIDSVILWRKPAGCRPAH